MGKLAVVGWRKPWLETELGSGRQSASVHVAGQIVAQTPPRVNVRCRAHSGCSGEKSEKKFFVLQRCWKKPLNEGRV
jgi:hypothetical protein